MPGVTFTRNSAQRISAAIRKIEEIPHGKQNLQRRRAGGLGRSTLWEVTAVQTGPGTVTIKRVSNIAFDLNDPSEKEDILYDPDNEPAVGDRGLLIRLGEGPLFFFRHAVVNRIYIDEHCYVDADSPDTAFGYPNEARSATTIPSGGGIRKIGVFKFASTLPQIQPTAAKTVRIVLPEEDAAVPRGIFAQVSSQTVTPDELIVNLNFDYIKEDFDPSTLTWNQYAALSKGTEAAVVFALRIRDGGNSYRLIYAWGHTMAILSNKLANFFSMSFLTYGFGITIAVSSGLNTGTLQGIWDRTQTDQGNEIGEIAWKL